MLTVKGNNLETAMEVEVEGKITKEDIEEFETQFKRKKEANDKLNLLMVVNEIKGYSLQAFVEDMKFSTSNWKEFNKIAVLTDKKWVELSTKVSKILPVAEVENFKMAEREQALEWLN